MIFILICFRCLAIKPTSPPQTWGIALTQEMLNFAAENQIKPQIEMIGINDVAEAYQNILDSKVHYRYVIDMATLK